MANPMANPVGPNLEFEFTVSVASVNFRYKLILGYWLLSVHRHIRWTLTGVSWP